ERHDAVHRAREAEPPHPLCADLLDDVSHAAVHGLEDPLGVLLGVAGHGLVERVAVRGLRGGGSVDAVRDDLRGRRAHVDSDDDVVVRTHVARSPHSAAASNATTTLPERVESRASSNASRTCSAGIACVATRAISGRAASSATASSISSWKRKAPLRSTSFEMRGARFTPRASFGTMPTCTIVPRLRTATAADEIATGAPEHSSTTSNA